MGIGAVALITFGFALLFGGSACDKIDGPRGESGEETDGSMEESSAGTGGNSSEVSTVEISDDSISGTMGETSEKTEESAMDFLQVQGNQIRDSLGPVILRGVNTPNNIWDEGPCPANESGDLTPCIADWVLAKNDYIQMGNWGVNLNRYAINWKRLVKQYESPGDSIEWNTQGFEDIRKHLDWAREQGVYVILDMHIPPGGEQSGDRGYALWTDENNQEVFIALWKKIAEEFSEDPIVAGYGLLNEPMPPLDENWQDLADRTVEAIREVDKEHMLVISNTLIETNNPDWNNPILPFLVDDDNVLYEFHDYAPGELTHQNAIWLGEYGYPGANYPDKVLKASDYLVSYDASACLVVTDEESNPLRCSIPNEWYHLQSEPVKLSEYTKLETQSNLVQRSIAFAGIQGDQPYRATNLYPAAFTMKGGIENSNGYDVKPAAKNILQMASVETTPNIGHIYAFVWNQSGTQWIKNLKLEKNCSSPENENDWLPVNIENGDWENKSAIYLYDAEIIPVKPPYADPLYYPPFWEVWDERPLSDPAAARQEEDAMVFSNAMNSGVISRWLNNYFEIENNCWYRISADIKGENIGALDPDQGINWNGIGISLSYVAPGETITWDYNYLEEHSKKFVDWAIANDVPLYLGEFGILPVFGNKSYLNWMTDRLVIAEKNNIHWTYWSYAESWPEYLGMGLICRNENSPGFCSKDGQINLLKEYY